MYALAENFFCCDFTKCILFYLFVSVNDVQLSCYRILTCLYCLGTGKNIFVER